MNLTKRRKTSYKNATQLKKSHCQTLELIFSDESSTKASDYLFEVHSEPSKARLTYFEIERDFY